MAHGTTGAIDHLDVEDGATAVEYALLIAFIALAIVGAVTGLGIGVDGWFRDPQLTEALS